MRGQLDILSRAAPGLMIVWCDRISLASRLGSDIPAGSSRPAPPMPSTRSDPMVLPKAARWRLGGSHAAIPSLDPATTRFRPFRKPKGIRKPMTTGILIEHFAGGSIQPTGARHPRGGRSEQRNHCLEGGRAFHDEAAGDLGDGYAVSPHRRSKALRTWAR